MRKKSASPTRMIALLRGINVGGHRKVPMAELRELATEARFDDVATHIQSGNLLFTAALDATAAEALLERGIEKRFGFAVDVIVRTAAQWRRYAGHPAFPDAAKTRPQLLLLALSKRRPNPRAAEVLRERAAAGERIELAGDALWIDYAGGVARSKLSPAAIDKAAGSPVTGRNLNTVRKLEELLG